MFHHPGVTTVSSSPPAVGVARTDPWIINPPVGSGSVEPLIVVRDQEEVRAHGLRTDIAGWLKHPVKPNMGAGLDLATSGGTR